MTAKKQDRPAHAELAKLDEDIASARNRAEDTRRRAADAVKDAPRLEREEREPLGRG